MSDREEDTAKTALMREAAVFIARIWMQHVRPLPFDRVFYIDGVRVRVQIDEHKTKDDTLPFWRSK